MDPQEINHSSLPYYFHTSKFPKWIFHMHNSTLAQLIMYAFGFRWCYTGHVYLSLVPWKTSNRYNALVIFHNASSNMNWNLLIHYIHFCYVARAQEFVRVKYFQLGLFTVCNVNTFNVITSVDISSGYERQLAAAHYVK